MRADLGRVDPSPCAAGRPGDRPRGGDLSGRSARVSPRMGGGVGPARGERVAAGAAASTGTTRSALVAFYRKTAGARYFADLESTPDDPARLALHEALRRDPAARVLDDRPGRFSWSNSPDPTNPAREARAMTTDTPRRPVSLADFARWKAEGRKIAMLTAYDYTMARLLDAAGVDCLLVGDSLGTVVQGFETTLRVTLGQMLYHAEMVARGAKRAFVVADLPFLSYQVSTAPGRPLGRPRAQADRVRRGQARRGPADGGDDPGDRRRRHPRDGPRRPDAAIGPAARRLQGPARRGADRRRRPGRGRGRGLRDRPRMRPPQDRRADHVEPADPDDRHRRGPRLRRPGARHARPIWASSRASGPSSSANTPRSARRSAGPSPAMWPTSARAGSHPRRVSVNRFR